MTLVNLKANISKVNSWSDFKNLLERKTKQEKGEAFEELTKYYLQYNPLFKTKLKHVWLQKETPLTVLKNLNLPTNDQGIDLIAETFEGTFWAIQCKYLQDEEQRLSHRTISTFVSLSTGIAENIAHCLVCTTVDEYAKIYKGKNNIGFVNSDEWRKLDKDFFSWLRNKLGGKETPQTPFKPKPHQLKALKEAKDYFLKENNSRGKLVFPCGAGKSLTGYWITKELKPNSIIVAVPSLSLVKQTLEVYLKESVANNEKISWLCVCSDEGIGTNDDIAIHTNEIGVPCVTDTNYIANWIKDNSKSKIIIFTTYQSGKTISEACKIAKHEFDLGIMDEAHKTVGDKDKLFSHLLFDENIQIKKRIFMTATERRYAGSSDVVLSMDDVNVYGDTFTQMSFKEAIEIGILSDYKIITLFISNDEVKKLIENNAFVKPTGKGWDKDTEARTLASLIALRKAMTDYPIHHAVTFHSSIKKAEAFEQSQSLFSSAYPQFTKVQAFHVSGSMPTSIRGKIVDEFAQTKKGIITNAKCLTEGVDVPNIDCVLFADPRKSTVDIVQSVGRALRRKEGKEFGYVILPVFTDSDNKDEIINSAEFKEILATIRALASNDERIIEYFRDLSKGIKKSKKDSLVQFNIDIQLSEKIDENELLDSIQLKVWDKLAKLSWIPFDEARLYIHQLNLKSEKYWREFCKSGKKPFNIPSNPSYTYAKNGWKSMGDWLGTYRIADQLKTYKPFLEARKYVHSLNLKNTNEWKHYCASGNKPLDIPANPRHVYNNSGWISMGDWLGHNKTATFLIEYMPFLDAKSYVRTLKFKSSSEWRNYCKSGLKPKDIPANPNNTYKQEGWISMSDWLGTGKPKRGIQYRAFSEARQFVHELKLKNGREWKEYCSSKERPFDIPSKPERVYLGKGWLNISDWLGLTRVTRFNEEGASFEDAKSYVHTLKLKSVSDWRQFCKTGNLRADIPRHPHEIYRDCGWTSWGDWLGTGRVADNTKVYRQFDEAKKYVHTLNLKSVSEWREYAKSEKLPYDIPRNPNQTYKNSGWTAWGDWLGTGREAEKFKEFYTYAMAKDYIKNKGLRSKNEFIAFVKDGNLPAFIPKQPDIKYRKEGTWIGWPDFLGK